MQTGLSHLSRSAKAWPFDQARALLNRLVRTRLETSEERDLAAVLIADGKIEEAVRTLPGLQKPVVFETGYGPSGLPHIGTFGEVARTQAAVAMVQTFLNDQAVKKIAKRHAKAGRPVQRAAVLGAGIMGGGIAYTSALKGVPVRMKDIQQAGLDQGMAEANKLLQRQVKAGRMDAAKADKVLAAITPRTKWLFLNMPGNPSGAVYSAAELQALGEVLARHPQVLILSDEIYEHILFDGRSFVSFGLACPDLRDRTLIVNGVAKAYAMTGWRVGYAAGPAPLLKAMNTVQSQSVTSVAAPMQAAALTALTGPQACISTFRDAFERRRDLVVAGVAAIPGLTLSPPEGAFYAYIGCAGLIGKTTPQGKRLETDADVTEYLLHHAHVGAVPGAAYGLSPFFRISTATADTTLTEAIARIARAVAVLSPAQAA